MKTAYFHLPGLFEFYELYNEFLPLFYSHREYFYDWCQIGSIYGSPEDCLWGGGRVESGSTDPVKVLKLTGKYRISARLTFSNLLLEKEHLSDKKCNKLCSQFAHPKSDGHPVLNGVIISSDTLLNYLRNQYPDFYFVSSTTKVLTDFDDFKNELNREEFMYVVPDFRLNKSFDRLSKLAQDKKDKVEFLLNECCYFGCRDRKACYEDVSRKNLGLNTNHVCKAPKDIFTHPSGEYGYSFSKAMENPGFISVKDIKETYMPMGFTNFKIEGRSLGSALILEFLLYYLTKPEYQIHVREHMYLGNTLDLF